MKFNVVLRLLVLFGSLALGTVTRAEDSKAILARMEQRLPQIDALKEKHVVGENNRGLLEARGGLSGSEQKLISDENADRRAVYESIAARTGSDPDTVGRRRAQQIAVQSKRGVWVQDASGEWRQKT